MTMNVPRIDNGIVALATMVDEAVPRNKKMTSTTSEIVISSVWFTSDTESRMMSELSETLPTVTPGGMDARNVCSTPFTSSATCTVFTPGCFLTARIMLCWPLIQNVCLLLVELVNTLAT